MFCYFDVLLLSVLFNLHMRDKLKSFLYVMSLTHFKVQNSKLVHLQSSYAHTIRLANLLFSLFNSVSKIYTYIPEI